MNVSNRDVLIDYILGRLSRADAEAVEEQARVDSELAQTLGTLRRELSDVAALSSLRGLPRALNRRLHDSSASTIHTARTEVKSDDSSRDSGAQSEKTPVKSEISSTAEVETTNEKAVESSNGNSERDSWSSLFSDAFASFAEENADAQEHMIARARVRAARNSEIKPVTVVPSQSERRLDQDSTPDSLTDDDQSQTEEGQNVADRKKNQSISLYDVEVRTASQPIRRRRRFEFIPKKVQAPTIADASGFTFKHAVALPEEQTKKRCKAERNLEASAPVLGERVVVSRASLDFIDSIPDFSSYLDVRVRVLRSKLAFKAPSSPVDDSPTFLLYGQSLADGFFTRATVETPNDRAEERFVVLPDVARGNFALCRGIIDSEKLDVDVLTPSLATSFWTSERVGVSNAYLVASTPYAPSTADLELRRRVERILAEQEASPGTAEAAVEFALPEIEETTAVTGAVPYQEAELAEETPGVETSALTQEATEETVSEIAPYPETELAEEASVVANTEETVSEVVPYPEAELAEETSAVEESTPALESAASSVSDAVPTVEEPSQVRSKLEYPVATFEVETPTSVAPEYVAPELAAPKSKIAQEPEPLEESSVEEPTETLLQNALIVPQQTDSWYASDDASVEDAEESGPTLSAEDRRLAELLGHTPTPLELDEFYWEDYDASRKTKRSLAESSATVQLLGGVFYVLTAPVVLVGHATLGVASLFLPRREEQKVLDATRRKSRKKRGKSDMFLDVAVPSIVGILIAIFVVFPFLLRSIDYAAHSIGGTVFRRVTGKVAVPSVLEEQLGAAMSAKMIEAQIGAENAASTEGQTDANESQAPGE